MIAPTKIRFAVSVDTTLADPIPSVRRAERLGFDSIWLSDLPLMASSDPVVALAALAVATEKVHLGVNLVPFGRNPVVLARQCAQIDRLSGGRLLLTIVPGLGRPEERAALGIGAGDRGPRLEELVEVLRRLWAGEEVVQAGLGFDLEGVAVEPRPVQEPLEVWLGGRGPRALERVARIGDGWLTAGIGPDDAGRGRATIERLAAEHGRVVDPEHFGISLPVARSSVPEAARRQMEALYPGQPLEDVLPIGAEGLRDHLGRHVEAGLSKFVLRLADPTDAEDDLGWLAEVVLPLQR